MNVAIGSLGERPSWIKPGRFKVSLEFVKRVRIPWRSEPTGDLHLNG